MLSMRTVMMTAVVVVAFCMGWLAKTSAQQKAPGPLITYFSHEKVDASFAQALASTGTRDLFARKDRQGRTWAIHSNSRGKADEGKPHSHERRGNVYYAGDRVNRPRSKRNAGGRPVDWIRRVAPRQQGRRGDHSSGRAAYVQEH